MVGSTLDAVLVGIVVVVLSLPRGRISQRYGGFEAALGIERRRTNADPREEKGVRQMADTYSCPMHPDVKFDNPGKCPKCGMALEKKNK